MIDRATFLALTSSFAVAPSVAPRPTQLPLTIGMNRCFVRATVSSHNRSEPALIWLDTGGGKVALRREVSRGLHLKTVDGAVEEDGQRFLPVEPFTVTVGNIAVRIDSRDGLMLDSEGFMPGVPADATFPVRLLRDHVVTFDYARKTLGIDTVTGEDGFVPVGISPSGFARMPVTIGGEQFQMLLDTGASCTMLSRIAIDRLRAANPSWKSVAGAYGDANMIGGRLETSAETLLVPEMQVAGTKLSDVMVVSRPEGTFEKWMSDMTDAPIIGSLAGNVLRNFAFTLDYPRARARFAYALSESQVQAPIVPLTLSPRPDESYAIAGVLDRAPFDALRERLVGAELVAVDGTPLRHAWMWQAHDLLRGAANVTKRLTLARNGKTDEVDVRPIDLWAK